MNKQPVAPRSLLIDDMDELRRRTEAPWGAVVRERIFAEAIDLRLLEGSDLADWPDADSVPGWARDERARLRSLPEESAEAFVVAMGCVERSRRVRSELFTLAAAAALSPEQPMWQEAACRYWRAPLTLPRWQHPGWSLCQPKAGMSADGDGEWMATNDYLVALPLTAELLQQWLTADDMLLCRRRVAEHCARIEDDFCTGRPWFFRFPARDTPSDQYSRMLSGLTIGALFTRDSDPRADRWCELGVTGLLKAMDATGGDGSYPEGVGFGLSVMHEVSLVGWLLQRQGDDRLLNHPQVRNFPYWLLDMTLNGCGRWLPLNDSRAWGREERGRDPRKNWAARVMALGVHQRRDPVLQWHLTTALGGPSTDIFGLIFHGEETPPHAPIAEEGVICLAPVDGWRAMQETDDLLPCGDALDAAGSDRRAVHYPGQGLALARSGFGASDVLVVVKGGWQSPGHDHLDRNGLLVYDGMVPVITEAGGGPISDPEFDTRFGSFNAHSTLELDGQRPSRLAKEHARGVEAVDVMPDGAVRLVGEASASYPALKRFRRTVIAHLPDDIEIVDEIVPADDIEHRAALWFHVRQGARFEGEHIEMTMREGRWQLSIEDGDLAWAKERPQGEGASKRMAFVARGPVPPEGAIFRFRLRRFMDGDSSPR